jgi:hypothetical protein
VVGIWDGSRYTALSEALFVALFAMGDGLLGSNPGDENFHFAKKVQCKPQPYPSSVFCSNLNKVSLVVHIAVSFSVHSVFSRVYVAGIAE